MTISIVTTTTGRPGCFALLERWMKRQQVSWNQWLVVGEDLKGYQFTMGQQVVKRKTSKKDALPSICLNWLEALPLITGDNIAVIDDDDFYSESYLFSLLPMLGTNRLVGVKGDLYFKLKSRKYQIMGNQSHASLACTAFRREMLPFIDRCRLHKSVFLDMYLWSEGTQDNSSWSLIPNKCKTGGLCTLE